MTHFVLDARTATPHFPGIGRYVSNLARAIGPLLASGEQLTVLHDPAHPVNLPASSSVRGVSLAASPFSLAQQWAVPQALRRLRADLYHCAYMLMPYLPGASTLLTVYDLIPLRYPQYSTPRARLLARLMTRLALRAAGHVIAISDFTRRDFMDEFHLAPDRITAIPLATDPAFHPQPPEAVAAFRRRCGLPECFVLYLGSNKPHKNLVRLVEAWRMADSGGQIPDCRLVIAGAWDDHYPEARQLADAAASDSQPPAVNRRTSGIQWLGPVAEADLPALYSAAAAFVFPSLYEGFGLPVLEAMACAAPVICSHASSLPEVAGEAALLVDPADTAALAEALRRVLSGDDLRAELRRRGLAQAARFTWAGTAAATLALYREMLA